jgi:hypothetical protein
MFALLFVVLLSGMQTRGQVPSNTAVNAPGAIEGMVVRAGAPGTPNQYLANARIELRGTSLTAITNPGGLFTFRNVPPGRYILTVVCEGFVIQEDKPHGITFTGVSVAVASGQILKGIILPMIPAPVLAGHVFHPNGEPLAAAVVQAFGRRYTPYGPRLKLAAKALSDDLGAFRLFWLSYGDYVVNGSYGDNILRASLQGVRLSPNFARPDDGYATVFYVNGSSPSDARPVRVAGGADEGNLNIILSDGPRFKIKGRVVSSMSLPPNLRIAFAAAGTDLITDRSAAIYPAAAGDFEVSGLSPGVYVFLATGMGFSSQLIPVTVTGNDVDNLTIPLLPTTNISGRVSGLNTVNGTRVHLTRSDAGVDQRVRAVADSKGTFMLPDVGVGDYDIYIESPGFNAAIRSIRFGATDALAGRLHVTPNTNAILEIALSVPGAGVAGRVVDYRGDPAVVPTIVLVPEQKFRKRTDRYFIGVADRSGNFSLNGIPAGQYTAFAFEQIEPQAYYAFAYSSEVNFRFATRGVPLTVEDSGRLALQLTSMSADETAGAFQ